MLSLLPLILMAVIVTGLGAMYWEVAVNTVRTGLEDSAALGWAWTWLERVGLMNLKAVLAPLVIILVVTPVVMVMSLLAVSFMMTPALAPLVDTAAGHTFAGIDMGMAHLQGHDLRCLG